MQVRLDNVLFGPKPTSRNVHILNDGAKPYHLLLSSTQWTCYDTRLQAPRSNANENVPSLAISRAVVYVPLLSDKLEQQGTFSAELLVPLYYVTIFYPTSLLNKFVILRIGGLPGQKRTVLISVF